MFALEILILIYSFFFLIDKKYSVHIKPKFTFIFAFLQEN